MNEILGSIKQTIKERLSSTMYGSFFFSWCVWNWKAVYITFFVNETLILNVTHQLKIDYLLSFYKNDYFIDSILNIVKLFAGPACSAIIIVWCLSWVEFQFFRKNTTSRLKKKKEAYDQEKLILKEEREILQTKQKNVEIEQKIEMSNEEKWDEDYNKLKFGKKFRENLDTLIESLYEYNGRLIANGEFGIDEIFHMSSDCLAYLDVNSLVNRDDNNKNIIMPTEKGKYFLKKHIQEKTISPAEMKG